MCGVVLGTVCLLALLRLAGCGWRGRRRHGGCGARCGAEGAWGERGAGHGPLWERAWGRGVERAVLRSLYERLDTTPGQEKVLREALRGVREALRGNVEALRAARGDIARAFAAEQLDETALAEAFTRHDEATQGLRRALGEALRQAHEVLDPEQRQELAALMSEGRGFRWRGAGPYRS